MSLIFMDLISKPKKRLLIIVSDRPHSRANNKLCESSCFLSLKGERKHMILQFIKFIGLALFSLGFEMKNGKKKAEKASLKREKGEREKEKGEKRKRF